MFLADPVYYVRTIKCGRHCRGSTALRGGIPGLFPPKWLLVPYQTKLVPPPSEDCAPNKLIGSGLQEYQSRPETRIIVLITLEFVSKNLFFCNIFVDSHRISWNFAYILGRGLFLCVCFFWSSPQNSCKNERFLRWQPEFVKIFELKTFFFGFHVFRLIHTLKFT